MNSFPEHMWTNSLYTGGPGRQLEIIKFYIKKNHYLINFIQSLYQLAGLDPVITIFTTHIIDCSFRRTFSQRS